VRRLLAVVAATPAREQLDKDDGPLSIQEPSAMIRQLKKTQWLLAAVAVLAAAGVVAHLTAGEWTSGKVWPEPKVIDPGDATKAPSDAIALFDGKDLSQWKGGDQWIVKDGYAISNKTSIETKRGFGSCQLHVEWAAPEKVVGEGQGRGNSGVFMMNTYEIQILDSHNNKTYFDGQCGSIYKQWPPLVNACRKPGQWQSYDIIFYAPVFKEGKLASPARITMMHNGVLVHHNQEIYGPTGHRILAKYDKPIEPKRPLTLSGHNNPVRFRNIWIRPL
jgi:hypothetical protein